MKYTRNYYDLKNFSLPLKIVGLTGGIASGKTVATNALIANGYTVIDADEISRSLTAHGAPLEKKIMQVFSVATAKDGTLDRAKLRSIISQDKSSKKILDELTHPVIKYEIHKQISCTKPPIILSAPLLFETALSELCDAVVCITCAKPIRISRIIARDGSNIVDATNIIASQLPDEVRASLADFCVPSDFGTEQFVEEIVELFDVIFGKKPLD